jgi:hypothetical protein
MPRVIDQIELHDSTVEFVVEGDALVLALRPAYVHHWEFQAGTWKGTGRTQEARIRLLGARPKSVVPSRPLEISNGSMRVQDHLFDGLIPAALVASGAVSGMFEFVDSPPISLTGTAIEVELVGPPTYVEDLHVDWAPPVGAA